MKKYLIVFVVLVVNNQLFGQLSMKNNTEKPYQVAIAFFHSSFQTSGWISKGWFTINPGETKDVFYQNPREKFLYYYAFSENDTIQGTKNILVDSKETFTVNQAILEVTKETNPNLKWVKFKEVRRGFSNHFKKRVILNIL